MADDPHKAERLAAALRANLARRKAQDRARKAGVASDDAGRAADSTTGSGASGPDIVPRDEPG